MSNLLIALRPLGDYKERFNQIKFNCPRCEESGGAADKYNLEVNIQHLFFKCWACGYHGYITKLIEDYGNKDLKKEFESNHEQVFTKREYKGIERLEFLRKINKSDAEIVNYLYLRGINIEDYEYYNIKYCYSGKYKNTIVFESYTADGILSFWIAHDWKNKKYHKPEGVSLDVIFWGDKIDPHFPIILVEGIYDSVVIPNSIPMLGLDLYSSLLNFIEGKNVILIVDEIVNSYKIKNLETKIKSVVSGYKRMKIPTDWRDPNYCVMRNSEFKAKLINQIELQVS